MTHLISTPDLETLATAALVASKSAEPHARSVARALVAADANVLASHGVSRLSFYAEQALSRKVDGVATLRSPIRRLQ